MKLPSVFFVCLFSAVMGSKVAGQQQLPQLDSVCYEFLNKPGHVDTMTCTDYFPTYGLRLFLNSILEGENSLFYRTDGECSELGNDGFVINNTYHSLNDNDAESGFILHLEVGPLYNWDEWLELPGSQGARNNCSSDFQSWLFGLIEFGDLSGFGIFDGWEFELSHQPSNGYYGFQLGQGVGYSGGMLGYDTWALLEGTINGDSIFGSTTILGVLEQIQSGCTNPDAVNFNASAIVDDGSCLYSENPSDCPEDVTGDGVVAIFDLMAVLEVYGSECYPTIPGCTNPLADNYASDATEDDGSCVVTLAWVEAPQDLMVSCESELADLDVWMDSHAGGTTNGGCGDLTWSYEVLSIVEGDCPNESTTEVELNVNDACDNSLTASVQLQVVDTAAPVFVTPPLSIAGTKDCGNDTLTSGLEFFEWWDAMAGAEAMDNCGEVQLEIEFSLTYVIMPVPAPPTPIQPLAWISATDLCGNYQTIGADYELECDVNLGCTDSSAVNYSPIAVTDNGTCAFATSTCEGIDPVFYNGVAYDVIDVNGSCWFAKNLRSIQYANGDYIYSPDFYFWGDGDEGAFTSFSYSDGIFMSPFDSTSNVLDESEIGYLYNWYAVNDERGLCPSGWRVPTNEDWNELEQGLGMSQFTVDSLCWRGSAEGQMLKSSSSDLPAWDGSNDFGFSALPAGFRDDFDGQFKNMETDTYWWASTSSDAVNAWMRQLSTGESRIFRGHRPPSHGLSVRCVFEE